jgi:hypothetical protein
MTHKFRNVAYLLLICALILCLPLTSYAAAEQMTVQSLEEENETRVSAATIQKELRARFSSINLGIDKWECTIEAYKNDDTSDPYDYQIFVVWTEHKVSATNLITGYYTTLIDKPYTDEQLEYARNALVNYQRGIYEYLAKKYPTYKFQGGFWKSAYRYPYIEEGLMAWEFLWWKNYTSGNYYNSTVSIFQWDTSEDNWGDAGKEQSWALLLYPLAAQQYADVYDCVTYAEYNKDLLRSFGNDMPRYIEHFVSTGMAEGRRASEDFDVHAYRELNPDLDALYGDDWKAYYEHYIAFGKAEGRPAVKTD